MLPAGNPNKIMVGSDKAPEIGDRPNIRASNQAQRYASLGANQAVMNQTQKMVAAMSPMDHTKRGRLGSQQASKLQANRTVTGTSILDPVATQCTY